ncbi:methionyl aminopeptidase [Mucilaginibacter yixingensis]|uniref:Methionine aminopeptidase n=1 Tax=Mucilaginibacter yixingensis TaxID=1295612 RepID=A0A2T5JDA4_9SPHI|nr:type I methionyl aminopeptidase [Mucilaginibacter yixingensis]PTQ99750.1 methionyl aminopeptidase [Mucilaginibacter yixingensis]
MYISTDEEKTGMQLASDAVAITLNKMRAYAKAGISTKELDEYGGQLLAEMGAQSAPKLAYNFPGYTCICVNEEVAHGVPSADKILKEGDLINIDVSAELNGFWADNGGSFILGEDIHGHGKLVAASKEILKKAISNIKGGVKISDIGKLIETEAKKAGYTVIKNLTGHGVGRSLHEDPHEIANYCDRENTTRFKKNSVVAIETFISTRSTIAEQQADGWTLTGNKGGFVAQHEHTIMVTSAEPVIFTAQNGVWD